MPIRLEYFQKEDGLGLSVAWSGPGFGRRWLSASGDDAREPAVDLAKLIRTDGGRILGGAVRLTARCHQPELRPDLAVKSITVAPVLGSPTIDEYVATVANEGASASGPFEVAWASSDASVTKIHSLKSLAPHASTRVRFRGPACAAADPPTITVDPAGQVEDRNRANNSLIADCAAG